MGRGCFGKVKNLADKDKPEVISRNIKKKLYRGSFPSNVKRADAGLWGIFLLDEPSVFNVYPSKLHGPLPILVELNVYLLSHWM
ncbi:hypothetical protein V6N13_042443 [Hibiscus sabdariffa]|uniref:Uncharacterized protein n=1 Tax=Hibiscus sabdariffa TaxID=183260 RepID=A0ABR2DHX6_9ROSI